jgi:hypothetical protein
MDLPEFLNMLIHTLGWEQTCAVLFDPTKKRTTGTSLTRLNTARLEMVCKSCRGFFQSNEAFYRYLLPNWRKYFPRMSAQVLLGNFEYYLEEKALKKYCREKLPTQRLCCTLNKELISGDAVAWMDAGGKPWAPKYIRRRAVQYENHEIYLALRKAIFQVRSNKNLRAKWDGKDIVLEFGKKHHSVIAMQASGHLDLRMNPTDKFLDDGYYDVEACALKSENWLLVQSASGLEILQQEGFPTCTGFIYFSEPVFFRRLVAAVGGSYKEIYFRTVVEMELAGNMEYAQCLAYLLSTRGARALIWRDFRKWVKGQATHSHIGNMCVEYPRNTSETFVMREGTF